ncbi:MAG: response regulator transcription factor [Dinghuibacter sp.]|nr:response regulator transcription factor [Dinghuibacter sp.]
MNHNTETPPAIKVALADDHILLRDALAALINSFEGYAIAHTAGNGKELVEKIEQGPDPDIILLDLNMPIMDGHETLLWLKANRPNITTLMLTMYDSETAIIRLLQAGVRGFLKKDATPAELLQALKTAHATGYYYSSVTSAKLAGLFRNNQNDPIQRIMLDEEETHFIKLCCSELTYKEIAELLHLSPRNVDSMRERLFEKLELRSRVGLALYAIKNGIVTV